MMVDGITQKQKKSRATKIFSTFRHFPTETFIFFKAKRGGITLRALASEAVANWQKEMVLQLHL